MPWDNELENPQTLAGWKGTEGIYLKQDPDGKHRGNDICTVESHFR